ncbi:YkvI family membrane protein [Paenibacillus sp. GYB003]|uniref:YkvI family membrane protein n=1 Tax=Paenibacillus sp. GYB003 TaxID=2994392 RepID=UPI002F968806
MRGGWISIIQIAATYIGTVVGAGFASGLSIVQFFTRYGMYGVAGILVATFLFTWLGTKMMVLSHRIQAFSYQELNVYLFGPFFGKIANAVSFVILFGVTSVMLSGAGSIFEEQLGLSEQWGMLTSLLLIYLVLIRQLKGILAINTLVVPMMLFFSAVVAFGYLSVDHPFGADPRQAGRWLDWGWTVSPFAYVALNLATLQAVLVPLGSEIERERELTLGGMIGGVGIGVMLLISHLSMNSMMPDILNYDIPMAEVIRDFGRFMHVLFIVVIYCEIFTTLIGNVFGMTRQIRSMYRSLPNRLVILTILFSCYAVSQMSFAVLLSRLYAVFGCVGLVLLLFLAAKRIPEK